MSWKIIIADDDPQSRFVLEQRLIAAGHVVFAFPNGREALARVRKSPVDAIISDALMPVMDGFQFCHGVKSDATLCQIPFLFYTATYTDHADEEFARRMGADRYLMKPDQAEELLSIVAECISQVRQGPPRAPIGGVPESQLLEEYTHRLSVKLENKLAELQRTNAELRRSEQSVRSLNEQLGETVDRLRQEVAERARAEELLRLAQRVAGISGFGQEFATNSWWWSPEAANALGLPASSNLSLQDVLTSRLHPADRTKVLERVAAAERQQSDFEVEARLVLKAGDEKRFQLRSEVFKDAEGRPRRRIGALQDITSAHAADLRRQALEDRLRQAQKMEAIGNLAGGIAHDFNNILTAILSHAELLQLELPRGTAPEQAADSVQEIVAAAGRAKDLVKQILTFSRKQSAERKALVLAPVVQEAVKLVRPAIPASIEVLAALHAEGRAALANSSQIHQVVLNLCHNAAQAIGDRPGTITVRLEAETVTPEFANAHPPLRPGPCLVLSVSDTGCGMSADTVARIFEPFFTTKSPGLGTGLGLAVAHGIVQGHEGAITVESVEGKGSHFRVYLPEAPQPRSSAKSGQRSIAGLPAGSGQRILFVDDEPSVAKIGVKLLERLGYEARAINDPEEARDLVLQDPAAWDLIISDYLMPRLTGVDMAKAIWAARPDLPMILAAGYGGQVDARRAKSAGFKSFMSKPFALQTLAEACANALK